MQKYLLALGAASIVCLGCSDQEHTEYGNAPLSENTGHDHGHGHAGKYGGDVLELDDAHAHHGELVFDSKTRDITVYLYGAEIGKGLPGSEVTLELHDGAGHDEKHVNLIAKASPMDNETETSSSRWTIAGSELPASIKSEEELDGHLYVVFGQDKFACDLEPHSHADHDHGTTDAAAHDDHDDHGEKGHADHDDDHDEKDHHDSDSDADKSHTDSSDSKPGEAPPK